MTDVVYIFGHGSKWNNHELMYSLRSIEKHLKNVGNVYLVGNLPKSKHYAFDSQFTNIIEIPYTEKHGKRENIIYKTLAACNHPDISDSFLCMYDDHFLLSDFDADSFPNFHKGELSEAVNKVKNGYRRLLHNTNEALKKSGNTTLNFNVHCPQPINKKLFRLPQPGTDTLIKSLYGNMNKVEATFSTDYKLFTKETAQTYLRQLNGAKFFSISDKALCTGLAELFNILYPTKSKYER